MEFYFYRLVIELKTKFYKIITTFIKNILINKLDNFIKG